MKKHSVCECGHEKIEDIICDICGNSCQTECGTIIDGKTYEFAQMVATWGYDSNYDGEHHTLDICVDCYSLMPNPWRDKVVRRECGCVVGFTGRYMVGLNSNKWEMSKESA
jgi:hypothetical protein